jgi:hypothetical protein
MLMYTGNKDTLRSRSLSLSGRNEVVAKYCRDCLPLRIESTPDGGVIMHLLTPGCHFRLALGAILAVLQMPSWGWFDAGAPARGNPHC